MRKKRNNNNNDNNNNNKLELAVQWRIQHGYKIIKLKLASLLDVKSVVAQLVSTVISL